MWLGAMSKKETGRRLGHRYTPRSDPLGLGAMIRILNFVLSAMGNCQRIRESHDVILFWLLCGKETERKAKKAKRKTALRGALQ